MYSTTYVYICSFLVPPVILAKASMRVCRVLQVSVQHLPLVLARVQAGGRRGAAAGRQRPLRRQGGRRGWRRHVGRNLARRGHVPRGHALRTRAGQRVHAAGNRVAMLSLPANVILKGL